MAREKLPLLVICGCSAEEGKPTFWALDTSDTRLFSVPERLRVDLLIDRLFDFLGKEYSDKVVFKPTVLSKRGEDILNFINRKMEQHADSEE